MLERLSVDLLEEILEAVIGFIQSLTHAVVDILHGSTSGDLGPYALPALYLVGIVVVFLAVWGIVHFIFKVIRYLILPAVILAALGAAFLPYSFITLLPFSAAACSLILLFKG